MRQIYLLFFLTLITVQAMAQWTSVPSGTSIDLRDVHFPTDSLGYIVGDFGIVLQTTDTGNTWQTVHLDSAYSFSSVYFTSNTTGYAAGGSLYKTTDAGSTWSEILTDSFNAISEVYFVNDSLGYAGAENSLYKTTNTGNTWAVEITGTITSSIHFPSDSVGYFIGGPGLAEVLYKTFDRGQSYVPITNGFQSIKEAIHFLNDTTGYMCGWYNPILVKTTDGGMNWHFIDTINAHQCWDVHFIDENIGYYIDNSGGKYAIRKTSDGGITWSNQLIQTSNNWLQEFFFIGTSAAIAVGDSGTVYKTAIGGSVGIQEAKYRKDIDVYPNPATDQITINLGNQIHGRQSVKIYSLLGQQIESFHLNTSKTTIDIRNLTVGVYLIVISDNHELFSTKKLIKK